MQLIDYGSIADWVAGVGTLLAVVAALWIAGTEQRHARRARERHESEQIAQSKQVIEEAIRLAEKIGEHCQTLLTDRERLAADEGGVEHAQAEATDPFLLTARGFFCIHEIAGLRQQVLALQSFGVDSARAYVEISRMAYEADITYPRTIDHRKVSTSELMRVKHDMEVRAGALKEIIACLG